MTELKDSICREVSAIHSDMLHSAVMGVVSRLICVLPCGGGHVEHLLLQELINGTYCCPPYCCVSGRQRPLPVIF